MLKIENNFVDSNGGFGLRLGAGAIYRNNVINGGSTVTGGLNTGGNLCNVSFVCP